MAPGTNTKPVSEIKVVRRVNLKCLYASSRCMALRTQSPLAICLSYAPCDSIAQQRDRAGNDRVSRMQAGMVINLGHLEVACRMFIYPSAL